MLVNLGEAKRDREWHEALCGRDDVAHTPAAVKDWLLGKLLAAVTGRADVERRHLELAKKRIQALEEALEACLEGAPHGWDPKSLKPVLLMCGCRWCRARRVLAEYIEPGVPAWRRQEG